MTAGLPPQLAQSRIERRGSTRIGTAPHVLRALLPNMCCKQQVVQEAQHVLPALFEQR